MNHHHCSSFTRSELLHRSLAGQGLPKIEPGMPQPAGTGLGRRSFLLRSIGSAMAVYGSNHWLPSLFEEGIAQAAQGDGRILISVFLQGGIDSLSVLAPVEDSSYRKLRPKLRLNNGIPFGEDARLHWNPSAQALQVLHSEGKLSVLPGIGYSSPDQSHFTSRHYWEVGELNGRGNTGWMGRYLDLVGSPDNPLQGLSLDGLLAPSLASKRVPVAAISKPADYSFWARGVWGDVNDAMLKTAGELGNVSGDSAMVQAGKAASQSQQLFGQLAAFRDEKNPPPQGTVQYPGNDDDHFPQRLKGLVQMIALGLPLRCVALRASGEYDTHDNQKEDFESGLKLTADSLLAFQRDLESRGLQDRVLVHVWSEFGRRLEENGSRGTDHGAAGIGFVLGSKAKGQMIGELPNLSKLDTYGNLKATSDFRALYASLCEQWLETDAGAVIPGAAKLARMQVVK